MKYMNFEVITDSESILKIMNDNEFDKYYFDVKGKHRADLSTIDATIIAGVITATGAIILPIVQELVQTLFKKSNTFKLKFYCNESKNSYEIEINLADYSMEKIKDEIHKLDKLCLESI